MAKVSYHDLSKAVEKRIKQMVRLSTFEQNALIRDINAIVKQAVEADAQKVTEEKPKDFSAAKKATVVDNKKPSAYKWVGGVPVKNKVTEKVTAEPEQPGVDATVKKQFAKANKTETPAPPAAAPAPDTETTTEQ